MGAKAVDSKMLIELRLLYINEDPSNGSRATKSGGANLEPARIIKLARPPRSGRQMIVKAYRPLSGLHFARPLPPRLCAFVVRIPGLVATLDIFIKGFSLLIFILAFKWIWDFIYSIN